MSRSRPPASDTRRFRFAFDIGGTFTDLVVSDGGGRRIAVGKCLTQPGEITRFVVEGLARLLEREQIPTSAIQEVVAGATTLVTNRIIERKGARTGLITTQGFGDVLEIRREMRYDIYDLAATLAEPIVPRHLRREVQERLDSEGGVLVPLGEGGVAEAIERLVADGVESLAVCFLHSYRNPIHERRVAEIAAASGAAADALAVLRHPSRDSRVRAHNGDRARTRTCARSSAGTSRSCSRRSARLASMLSST